MVDLWKILYKSVNENPDFRFIIDFVLQFDSPTSFSTKSNLDCPDKNFGRKIKTQAVLFCIDF